MIVFTVLIGLSTALNAAPDVLQSALSDPATFTALFSEYQVSEGRSYAGAEVRMRASIFRSTLREIAEHNSVEGSSWKMGLNKFSDMTEDEKASYTGFNMSTVEMEESLIQGPGVGGEKNPSEKDWRGIAVTKVKNQGSCASCWVFSAVGALEGHYKSKGSILKSFSEQEGLDCVQKNGCKGGWMFRFYGWLRDSNRLAATKDVPYTAKQGTCNYDSKPNALIAFKVTGYNSVGGDSTHESVLANEGPIAVSFAVASDFFKYETGIYNKEYCSGGSHAVTSVGYTSQYFRMKNSWGAEWGEKGFFRIARGNVCGITKRGFTPKLEATGKKDDGKEEEEEEEEEDCVDLKSGCGYWKNKGYCETEFCTKNCRKTCGKCDDDNNDKDCQKGFKKCPDGRCVHEHWHC